MQLTLIISLLVFFSVLIRMMFLLVSSTDDYVHFFRIKHFLMKKKFPKGFSKVFPEGRLMYPPIAHWFYASLSNSNNFPFIAKLVNIFFDVTTVIIFFFAGFFLFVDQTNELSLAFICFLAALIGGTAPILFPVTGRLRATGARTFGLLLISIIQLSLYAFYASESIEVQLGALAVCLFSSLLIFKGSVFAVQYWIPAAIVLSVTTQDLIPLAVMLIPLLIFVLFLGGKSFFVHKMAHFRWYIRNIKGTTAEGRNQFLKLLNPKKLMEKRLLIKTLFVKNSFFIALYSAPLLIPTLMMEGHPVFLGSIWASLIMFLLTSQKPFIYLGEAERYFEYSSYPMAIVFIADSLNGGQNLPLFLAVVLLQVGFIVLNLLVMQKNELTKNLKSGAPKELAEVKKVVRTVKGRRIITAPVKLAYYLSTHDRSNEYYVNWMFDGRGMDYMEADQERYDYIKSPVNEIFDKYRADYFVFDKINSKYDLSDDFKVEFENARYLVGSYGKN